MKTTSEMIEERKQRKAASIASYGAPKGQAPNVVELETGDIDEDDPEEPE